ncbi:hypothetical protein G5714_024580 [Onychostoma macrolepis]|uniref:Uncharacterized protein n=1 Tax=Onychostoma macrolepis TaxID=369639 RepID=A0A7J6BHQ1_9TELE|nr:hypothetical protein G5714_024580 [Onychostoma macrolepis]
MDGAGRRAHTRPSAARKSMVTEMRLGSGRAARWRGSLGAGRGPSPSDGGLARGRCEAVAAPPAECGSSWSRVAWECSPKIQPGGSGRPGRCAWIPSVGTAARPLARPPSAHFFRGGARDRLGLARKGRAKVARSLRVMSFTEPPRSDFAAYPGSWAVSSRLLSSRRGGAGPLAPGVCVDRRTVLSPSPTAPAPSGRGSGPRKGCSRSAAVGHPPDPS